VKELPRHGSLNKNQSVMPFFLGCLEPLFPFCLLSVFSFLCPPSVLYGELYVMVGKAYRHGPIR